MTAAKTRRIFDVSVACVKLAKRSARFISHTNRSGKGLLWVEVQVCPVDLIEPPE